jgi:hypothetical protein
LRSLSDWAFTDWFVLAMNRRTTSCCSSTSERRSSEMFSGRGAAPPACHSRQDRPSDGAGEPSRRERRVSPRPTRGSPAWHPTALGGQDERLDRGAECCQRTARSALLCQNVRHDVSVIHLKLKPLGELFDCFQRVRKNLVAGVGPEPNFPDSLTNSTFASHAAAIVSGVSDTPV